MDYFDPFADEDDAITALRGNPTRFLLASFDTDWRFPTTHSQTTAAMLRQAGCDVVHQEVASPWGHDSFLLPVPEYLDLIDTFLSDQDPRR